MEKFFNHFLPGADTLVKSHDPSNQAWASSEAWAALFLGIHQEETQGDADISGHAAPALPQDKTGSGGLPEFSLALPPPTGEEQEPQPHQGQNLS